MRANVRIQWARRDYRPLIVTLCVALVGLAVACLLVYGIAVTSGPDL